MEYENNLKIPPDVEPSEYYTMIMCHGISVGNEAYFTKALTSVGNQSKSASERDIYTMISSRPFKEVQQMSTAKFREMMSGALQLSIRRQREVIAHDLLQFAISRSF